MPKYTAYYRCSKCSAIHEKTISAPNDQRAIFLLPRWLSIEPHARMRRNGGIYKRGDNDK
jgi:hypothetical protein